MCLSNQDLDEKMQNCISNAKSLLNKRYWSVKNTNKILKKNPHTLSEDFVIIFSKALVSYMYLFLSSSFFHMKNKYTSMTG